MLKDCCPDSLQGTEGLASGCAERWRIKRWKPLSITQRSVFDVNKALLTESVSPFVLARPPFIAKPYDREKEVQGGPILEFVF